MSTDNHDQIDLTQPGPVDTASAYAVSLGPGAGRRRSERSGGPRSVAVAGGVAVAVAAVAVGGFAFANFLSGGGAQPEDVLPANTVAFAKVDLDPSAEQKLNAFALLRKFPDAKVNDGDLKATLFEEAFNDNEYGLTYATDIAPWLGDRVAVAAVPAPGTDDNLTPVLVLEFTDQEKMTAALDKLKPAITEDLRGNHVASADAPDTEPGTGTEFAYAIRDSYVLISDHQGEVDDIAAATTTLAADATFTADKSDVAGDGKVALGWADLGRVYDILPTEEKDEFATAMGDSAPAGRFAAAVSLDASHVELVGVSRDVAMRGIDTSLATGPGTSLVRGFPADTDVAFSMTGLGDGLVKVWEELGSEPMLGTAEDEARSLGLNLPEDLAVVFGTEFAVGAQLHDDLGDVAVRATTPDADRAVEALAPLLSLTGEPDLRIVKVDGGYVAATDDELSETVAAGTGGLGEDPIFTAAVADAEDAHSVLFVNIDALTEAFGGSDADSADPLQAFGVSAFGDNGNGQFTARLTFK